MKVLVTGGCGFIGSHLVDRLIEEGNDVVVIDDVSTGSKSNLNPKAVFFEADINSDLTEAFKSVDHVFHLAAQMNVRKSIKNPMEDAKINIIGSLNVINQCAKNNVKKIIFSSTGGAIYSPKSRLPCNESSIIEPQSPYGLAKFTVENYLRIYKNVYDLDFAALRYANVYGPRQNPYGEAGVVSIFINNSIQGKPMKIFGDGKQTRDFVYVDDVVEATLSAIKLSGIYNVSTNKETTVNHIAGTIKSLSGGGEIKHDEEIKGELRRSCLDNSKLLKTGWKPKTGLDEGLKKTFEWFKTNKDKI